MIQKTQFYTALTLLFGIHACKTRMHPASGLRDLHGKNSQGRFVHITKHLDTSEKSAQKFFLCLSSCPPSFNSANSLLEYRRNTCIIDSKGAPLELFSPEIQNMFSEEKADTNQKDDSGQVVQEISEIIDQYNLSNSTTKVSSNNNLPTDPCTTTPTESFVLKDQNTPASNSEDSNLVKYSSGSSIIYQQTKNRVVAQALPKESYHPESLEEEIRGGNLKYLFDLDGMLELLKLKLSKGTVIDVQENTVEVGEYPRSTTEKAVSIDKKQIIGSFEDESKIMQRSPVKIDLRKLSRSQKSSFLYGFSLIQLQTTSLVYIAGLGGGGTVKIDGFLILPGTFMVLENSLLSGMTPEELKTNLTEYEKRFTFGVTGFNCVSYKHDYRAKRAYYWYVEKYLPICSALSPFSRKNFDDLEKSLPFACDERTAGKVAYAKCW